MLVPNFFGSFSEVAANFHFLRFCLCGSLFEFSQVEFASFGRGPFQNGGGPKSSIAAFRYFK